MITEQQKQNAIDAINSLCESALEYETSHIDAGDNYAFMVAESWDEQKTLDLFQYFAENSCKFRWELFGIDKRWQDIESDTLSDMALDSFNMAAGGLFGPFDNDVIILDSFPIGEIEVCLDHLDIDHLTMDLVRESCDAYITGSNFAYISTDRVWFAVLDVGMFNAQIEQHFQDKDDSQ